MNFLTPRSCFYGVDTPMPATGGCVPRVYLNNAATPQILKPVIRRLTEWLSSYAYDNETNFLSRELRRAYGHVRETALAHVGGDPARDAVIFTPTTTTAINLLGSLFGQAEPDAVVLTTRMEHMANYLPYRDSFETVLVRLTATGNIDMDDYRAKLIQYASRVKLVAVTGASNITGVTTPFYEMASLAHAYGARIFLDAVQLVQHLPFTMKPHYDGEHIDFLSFDGHKCYTGQSGGVLIGPKAFLDTYQPMLFGAGITDFVSEERVVYRDAPERFEAGYPDFLGILSMGAALQFLQETGLEQIARQEAALYQRLVRGLREIPKLILYGDLDGSVHAPFAAFNLAGMPYQTLSRRLGEEYGIAVAAGTSGANLYVQDLLGLSDEQAYSLYLSGANYGVVRASIGLMNSREDIDRLLFALRRIAVA